VVKKIVYFGEVKSLSPLIGVLTAFTQRLKNCRTPRCALCKRQQCSENAVQSPSTSCGGVYFEHAQNVRQHAVATLWGLLERRGRVVSAPPARCNDAVQILHLE